MGKLITWMAALLMLATPQLAAAQRGGQRTGGMSGGSYPRDTDNDIKDIQKMVAVQATEEQRSQFQSWTRNTEAVKLRLQELRPAVATKDYSSQLNALKAAMEKSSSGYHDFVSSLTQAQHAGLKKPIQKLGKTNDESAKTVATAIRELGPSNSSTKTTAKLAKAEAAIENLLIEQKTIADEMGISS
jgi:hypothetical protein